MHLAKQQQQIKLIEELPLHTFKTNIVNRESEFELHHKPVIGNINEDLDEKSINESNCENTNNELHNDDTINESINENTINELHKNESKFERLIKYDVMMMRPNNAKPLIISFDEVDKYDFKKNAFIEFIISEDFVHLYFDFDTINTIEELNDVIKCVIK